MDGCQRHSFDAGAISWSSAACAPHAEHVLFWATRWRQRRVSDAGSHGRPMRMSSRWVRCRKAPVVGMPGMPCNLIAARRFLTVFSFKFWTAQNLKKF